MQTSDQLFLARCLFSFLEEKKKKKKKKEKKKKTKSESEGANSFEK
jgi:hypothetical protein